MFITLGIIITSIAGLLLAQYIRKHKYSDDHKVCPLGKSCEPLVNGRFSRFLGVSTEKLGTIFYILMIIIYAPSLFRAVPEGLLIAGLMIAGAGLAFCVYLAIAQIFVVKKWCTLSIGSIALTFLVTVLAFLGYEDAFVEFAYNYQDLLRWLYMAGVIIGTLITTLHARRFMRFLKDFKITRKEEGRLEMFSEVAWVCIGLSFLSGLGLVLTDRWQEFTGSPAFNVMLIILVVLMVYEVVVNMVISPKLVGIHFGDIPKFDDHKHSMQRKTAFAFIAVGVVSWYYLLLLSSFQWYEYSSGKLFVAYIILTILAVFVAMMVETIVYRKSLALRDAEKKTEENN